MSYSVPYLDTKAEFDKALAEVGDKLVVVHFTALWSGACKVIGPKFEEMSAEFMSVAFYKIDVDKNNETADSEGISCFPTFVFYKNGKKIDSFSESSKVKLCEFLRKYQ